MIITDGSKGLINAIEIVYPHAKHQRCWVHKLRNATKTLKRRIRRLLSWMRARFITLLRTEKLLLPLKTFVNSGIPSLRKQSAVLNAIWMSSWPSSPYLLKNNSALLSADRFAPPTSLSALSAKSGAEPGRWDVLPIMTVSAGLFTLSLTV